MEQINAALSAPLDNLSAEEARSCAKAFDSLPYSPKEATIVAQVAKIITEHARLGFGEVIYPQAISDKFMASLEARGFRVTRRWHFGANDYQGLRSSRAFNRIDGETVIQWDMTLPTPAMEHENAHGDAMPYFPSFIECYHASEVDEKERQERYDQENKERSLAFTIPSVELPPKRGCAPLLVAFVGATILYICM